MRRKFDVYYKIASSNFLRNLTRSIYDDLLTPIDVHPCQRGVVGIWQGDSHKVACCPIRTSLESYPFAFLLQEYLGFPQLLLAPVGPFEAIENTTHNTLYRMQYSLRDKHQHSCSGV